MTNAYADLSTLKSSGVLNITGTGYDTRLRKLLDAVSRLMDQYCNRHFFVLVATKTFDGGGGTELHLPDLISVTSLKTDDNKDRTFETTWASTDYLLYPPNAEPTKRWGRPYNRVLVDTEAGNGDVFTAGMKTVEIVGEWGYRKVTEDSGADVNEAGGLSATDTTLTVTDGSKFAVAQTILVDSEQLYITAIATNDLTVTRGVNGTTARPGWDSCHLRPFNKDSMQDYSQLERFGVHYCHPTPDIYVFKFPGTLVETCLIQSSRLWKRKDSGFSSRVGLPQTGEFAVFRGLAPDVRQLLSPYRKPPVGVGT